MSEKSEGRVRVEIENLGGINSLTTSLPSGVTILSGQNATNRTSFLRSIAGALGGKESAPVLKSDANQGEVKLEIDDSTASRTYERSNGSVIAKGDPLIDTPEIVDTYVSIFSTNPARIAIRGNSGNLREILMRGVDTAAIKSEIRSLKQRKQTLEDQKRDIEAAQEKLPAKEEKRQQLKNELEEVQNELSEVEQEIEDYKATTEEIEAAEDYLETLETRRENLRRVENRIERTQSNIASLEEERESIEKSLNDFSLSEEEEIELEGELQSLESQIDALQNQVAELSDIISHNRSILEADGIVESFQEMNDVTSQIDPSSSTVHCWTCGSEVERTSIESRIDTLQQVRQEKNSELQALRQERSEIEQKLSTFQNQRHERNRLESELSEIESAIESEQASLQDLTEKKAQLEEDVSDLQEQVSETEELRNSDLPEAYERLSQLEHTRGQKETQIEQVEQEIAELEEVIDSKGDVEEEMAQIQDELEAARGRIERIENQIVDKFNNQMDDLLDRMGYENISRVWLERIIEDGSQASDFEIHLVREAEDGTVYEDTLSTLSESERELIGIMVALAGYFVHEVSDEIPVLLFDSVEAIDADRLESLLDYIKDFAPYIVIALLPEEASAIDRRTIHAPEFIS